jgi:hypothetical protein
LCRRCFDYEALVIWNATVPELWRRTMIYLQRELARAADMTLTDLRRAVRVSYVKVAEYQARGAVHLHAVLRLDGVDGEPPPSDFDEDLLAGAIGAAVPEVTVRVEAGDRRWFARWGEQLDTRPIGESAEMSREAVAAYIAKYATKSSDQFDRGCPESRGTSGAIPMSLRDLLAVGNVALGCDIDVAGERVT